MKRSGSRASKVSTDAQDPLENSFPGIPDAKWHEFLEREETDLFILGLREEIVQKCLEICFESYLEKQAVSFTVHCAYLAWCKVLNVYYMVRDPGDSDNCNEKESWEPDPEPEPSIIDSWGSQSIVPLESKVAKKADEPEKDIYLQTLERTVCGSESVESCSFVSHLFNVGEGEYFFLPTSFSRSSLSARTKKKSELSSDFSMSLLSRIRPPDNSPTPCDPINQKSGGRMKK